MTHKRWNSYGSLASLFATARFPDEGKPLGNNTRIYRVEDPHFGEGYRIEHYSTSICTRFPGAFVAHRGALSSLTSKSRLGEGGLYVWESKEAAYFRSGDLHYVWPTEDLLFTEGRVYRVYFRVEDLVHYPHYVEELSCVEAKYPRPLPKSRNTLTDPKVGDAFSYRGENYIWVKHVALGGGGPKSKHLVAIPYAGDNDWHPTWVHVPSVGAGKLPSPLIELRPDDGVSYLIWMGLAAEATPIKRTRHSNKNNPTLEVPDGSES